MTSAPAYRPVAAVGLTVALLAYIGCSSSTSPQGGGPTRAATTSTATPKAEPASDRSAAPKTFAGWPSPSAAILVSGEQLGYLEPCGCSEGQLGGLLRRSDLIEKLTEERHWPLVRVDLGSLIKDPNAARGGPEQTKLKLHASLEALAALKYNALALSPEDLKVGVDEAVGQFLNLPGEGLKVVAANVTVPGLEAKLARSVRVKAGAVSIGVTAVVDPERLKALKDPALDLLTIKTIEEALPLVLADLEKDTTVQVLLVQGPPDSAKVLAAKYPGFEVVVATATSPDPPREAESVNGGKTLIVNVGQKGKYVGVVGVFDDKDQPLRYERVTLNNQYNGPALALKAIIEGQYRQNLKDQGVVANFPRHEFVNGAQGATFVGADSCKSCHPNTYTRWSLTKHARAFASLEKDPKPNTIFDAECVSCHTTGFEYNSGWKSAETTAFLKGNQCENCHGPGSRHVEEPDGAEFRSLMHLTADLADKNRLCLHCHDEDNSPHFDFGKYYGQIAHKGLDDYKAPKVHQGRPAPVGK